jgi:hypothetical protein
MHNSLEATMKKLLITAALLAVTASTASAQGALFLSWANCYPQNTLQVNRNDNCYVCPNSLDQRIILSFTAPATANIVSTTSILDVQFGASQPDYWRFDAAGCRAGAASINLTYIGNATLCPDIMGASVVQVPILATFNGWKGPNTMRIVVENTRDNFLAVTAGSHYTASQLNITHLKTTVDCDATPTPDATPVCAGCNVPATIALNEMQVTPQSGGAFIVTDPGARHYVNYFGGVGVPTATQNKTWGAVKSLYRGK